MLNDDEFTVLMIAADGELMIPIGRWQKPCEDLVAKGFLQPQPSPGDPTGNFNLHITRAGKAACAERDQEDNKAVEHALFQMGRHAEAFKQTLEQAAKLLAQAAQEHPAGSSNETIERCGKEVIAYAKELAHAK